MHGGDLVVGWRAGYGADDMTPTNVVRRALWATVPANFGVAALVLVPGSAPATLLGFPDTAPHPVYRVLLALFLALFGAMYAWLAMQPRIDRSLVALGAIGKALACTSVAALWAAGHASGRLAAVMSGDLGLALVFWWWLRRSRVTA